MSGLKPCPFCGRKPHTEITVMDSVVLCPTCRARVIGRNWRTKDALPEVEKTWNSRPIEDALTARIAELEEGIRRHKEAGNSEYERWEADRTLWAMVEEGER